MPRHLRLKHDAGRKLTLLVHARWTYDAIAMLHEASGGRLRDLDRIATETLKRAARRKLKKVDRQLVHSTLDTDSD